MHQTRRKDDTPFLQSMKRCILSLLGIVLLFLVIYNGFSVFRVSVPFPRKSQPQPAALSLQIPLEEPTRQVSAFSSPPRNTKVPSSSPSASSRSSSSAVLFVVKEESPPAVSKSSLFIKQRSDVSSLPTIISTSPTIRPKKKIQKKHKNTSETLHSGDRSRRFQARMNEFLSKSSCQPLFFMTWISSIDSFGDRELFAIESLFKSHPSNGCLIIVSNSLDSKRGRLIFKPFSSKGFKVMAIRPDFGFIFKNTSAETWLDGIKKGKFNPGVIPLEQNLSNLLRLVLLYKYGGVYIDTDVIILKNLSNLRNAIGAQSIDYTTRQWSRLNNAVLIFEKNHPLLKEFIDEFALTFNGNKWGHNGPYLVSRVVARVVSLQQNGLDFTILPPSAFYPVDWKKISGFYRAPVNGTEAKWVHKKLEDIGRHSFGIHLWNRESRKLKIEEGSIIHHIISDCCIFCNSSSFD